MGFQNGAVLRVALEATKAGRSQVNTFHYDVEDTDPIDGSTDPQTLADYFRDHVRGDFGGAFPPSWSIQPVVVTMEKDPLNPNAPRRQWQSGAAIPGTGDNTSDLLPAGLCTLVTLHTDHIGRRATGRTFVGGVRTEGNQANGLWNTNVMNAVAAYMSHIPRQPDLVSGFSWSTAKWSVYSRTTRALNQNPYLQAITSTVVHPEVHYLRRREGNQ